MNSPATNRVGSGGCPGPTRQTEPKRPARKSQSISAASRTSGWRRLMSKIEYLLNSNHSDKSIASEFFTDDFKLTSRKNKPANTPAHSVPSTISSSDSSIESTGLRTTGLGW
jgi:hypothetical protein